MAQIQIRISAALDPSVPKVFQPLEQAAARAQAKVRGTAKAAGADAAKEAERAASAQAKALAKQAAQASRESAQVARAFARADAEATKSAEQAAHRRARADIRAFDERLRASKKARAEEEREILRTAAAAERADARRLRSQQRQSEAGAGRTAREFGHRSLSSLGTMTRFGMGVAGEVARGAGVDLDLSNSVGRNVQLARQATELSNAGYNPSSDVEAQRTRVNPADIKRSVKEAADANAFSRTETMAGLQAFVGKTGDLRAGMGLMKELGALSKATGTDLGDMIDAAGDAFSALEGVKDPEERMRRTSAVMKAIAGQGKLGAVEIKNLASQMAKLGANANAFEGDSADNLVLLGAFAQSARAKGGAASATQATTSVASLVNTFKTPARIKAFAAEGIDVMNERGQIRNPEQLVMAALAKTQGDPERFKKMFANVQGARAVEGFATTYRTARGAAMDGGASEADANDAGLKAVAAEFDKFKKIAMGEGEIRESLTKRLADDDSKAQRFNNAIDDITGKLQGSMAPALEAAGPHLLKLAEIVGGWVVWAAQNPFKGVAVAIGAALLKAGIETAVANGIAKLMERATGAAFGGGAGKPGAGGKMAGAMGAAGGALTIAAAAVTIEQVGELIIDKIANDASKEENARIAEQNRAFNMAGTMSRIDQGQSIGADEMKDLQNRMSELNSRIEIAKGAEDGGAGDRFSAWVRGEAGTFGFGGEYSQVQGDKGNLDALRAEMAEVKAAMERASVVSAQGSQAVVAAIHDTAGKNGPPGVDPGGRTGKGK